MKKRLLEVQKLLKAPKNQRNNFGKYNYRSAEDIIEAVKPLLFERGLLLLTSDKVISVGTRVYIEATATVYDVETDKSLFVTASARESETKKGMDDSQITGSTSSYARKYALNGLFGIDDTKDADTNEQHRQVNTPANRVSTPPKPVSTPVQSEEEIAQEAINNSLIEQSFKECKTMKSLQELWQTLDAKKRKTFLELKDSTKAAINEK